MSRFLFDDGSIDGALVWWVDNGWLLSTNSQNLKRSADILFHVLADNDLFIKRSSLHHFVAPQTVSSLSVEVPANQSVASKDGSKRRRIQLVETVALEAEDKINVLGTRVACDGSPLTMAEHRLEKATSAFYYHKLYFVCPYVAATRRVSDLGKLEYLVLCHDVGS